MSLRKASYPRHSRAATLLLLTYALTTFFFRCPAADTLSETPPPIAGQPSLRQRFDQSFIMGVAMDGNLPASYNAAELNLLRAQFAAITPANCMKMPHLQPKEGNFEFSMADSQITFASSNQMKVC